MSSEPWRLKVVHHKTNVWGGDLIRAMSYILMEGDRRIGAFDTEEIGERIVREHNAALSAREPAGGEAALREALAWYADEGNYQRHTEWRETSITGTLVGDDVSRADDDHGQRARAALAAHPARDDGAGEEVRRLREIASGMAACVQALDRRGAWFSRSHTALTLRDSLRAWADDFAAQAAAPRAGEGE